MIDHHDMEAQITKPAPRRLSPTYSIAFLIAAGYTAFLIPSLIQQCRYFYDPSGHRTSVSIGEAIAFSEGRAVESLLVVLGFIPCLVLIRSRRRFLLIFSAINLGLGLLWTILFWASIQSHTVL